MHTPHIVEHKFKSGIDIELLMFRVDVNSIAITIEAAVDVWEEDGLGTKRGFFIELSNACIILVSESDHGRKHLGHPGPVVYVDGLDAIEFGYDALVTESLNRLSLTSQDIYKKIDDKAEWKQYAEKAVKQTAEYRQKRNKF